MNSLECTSIQGFKLAMRALLGGTFLPVQLTCKKKAKSAYRLFDPGRTGPLRALAVQFAQDKVQKSINFFCFFFAVYCMTVRGHRCVLLRKIIFTH